MEYILNKVEGFDPEKYIEEAKNSRGETITDKNGKSLKYLSTAAKVTWFRMVHPAGRICVKSIPGIEDDFGTPIRYKVTVYDGNGAKLSEWHHQETVFDLQDIDQTISKVQTIALGKALSKAGFGCEIELKLGLESVENEVPSETAPVNAKPATAAEPEKPKSKRGRKKKVQEEPVTEEKKATITDENQINLISDIDQLLAEADQKSESASIPEVDPLKKALETVVVCNENANVTIKSLEGKTIEEVLSTRATFCDFVKSKENIRSMLSKETVDAAIYVADNQ